MNHPAELTLHQYMTDAVRGESAMTEDTIQQVSTDVADALRRQFGSGKKRGDFRIRMSNVGRPTCQLWYEKNKPEVAIPMPTTFYDEHDDWRHCRSCVQRSSKRSRS